MALRTALQMVLQMVFELLSWMHCRPFLYSAPTRESLAKNRLAPLHKKAQPIHMELWQALILAVIEGLTEYLPVSSTGHIILGSAILGIHENPLVKDYTVIVQFGAILSVLVVYRERFKRALSTVTNAKHALLLLFVSVLPAIVIGLLFNKVIDRLLESVATVGWTLLLGGVVLLFADRIGTTRDDTDALGLPLKTGTLIGFSQCLAMIPGISRSGASIVGGLGLGLSRKTAAEFSFFLAVPTLTAASGYKLLKMGSLLNVETVPIIVVGNLASFIVGILAIRSFIRFLTSHGFFWFGVYRIILGLTILTALWMGHELKML